jgi:hypothetical protein
MIPLMIYDFLTFVAVGLRYASSKKVPKERKDNTEVYDFRWENSEFLAPGLSLISHVKSNFY